jgi:hypothetical protein
MDLAMLNRTNVAGFVIAGVLAVACGSSEGDSAFPNGDPNNPNGGGGFGGGGGDAFGGGTGSAASAAFSECAANVADGEAKPVHMILAVDTSGSMCEVNEADGNKNCDLPTTKWSQIKSALSSFFSNASSKDVYVSLIPWAGGNCGGFDRPLTAEVALPDTAGTLNRAVQTLKPEGATPTHGAIDGAQRYATLLKSTLTDGGKVVIALATDGLPTGCSNLPQSERAATAASTAGTSVYVIGVGSAGGGNLQSLAVAGGTKSAFNVSNANAAAEFAKALEEIKGNALGCNLRLPTPPAGASLDLKKVNVVYNANPVGYSQDCSDKNGWRYVPDSAKPDGIELCETMCSTLKNATSGAKLKLVLGCATSTGPTK